MDSYKALDRNKNLGSTHSLLKKGIVPGIIYGKNSVPTKIALEDKILNKLMNTGAFYSTIIDIDIDGKVEKILPKQLQYHPVSDRLIHFDFLRVQENTEVNVDIPVEFLNQDKCPGLKKGGVLNTVRRLVELTCNANNIPDKLEFDLIKSEIGDAIKISNINLPDGVSPTITDRDFVIATLVPPTVEVETKTDENKEEGSEEQSAEKAEDKKDENQENKEDNKESK